MCFEVKSVEQDADVVVIRARVVNTPRGPGPAVDYDAFYGCRLGEEGFSYWRSYDSAEEARAELGAG